MPHIGKVNKDVLIELYNDFQNIDCDLLIVKTKLLNIIQTYCEIENAIYMSFDVEDYQVHLCKIYGLKMTVGSSGDVCYMFCIKTGNIYYATSPDEYVQTPNKCLNVNPCLVLRKLLIYQRNKYNFLKMKMLANM
jgi:hypothetical protein